MRFTYLAGRWSGKLFAIAGVCAGVMALSLPASADTFSVQYFEVTTSTSTTGNDFHTGNVPTGTVSNNYVLSTLSGGMPQYNTGETGAAGASDVTGGKLDWWTPGTYGPNTVASTGSGILNVSTNPASPTEMFPPNSTGSGNQGSNCMAIGNITSSQNCEETAILTGTFSVATNGSTVNFSVSADDDAFVFIDGTLVEDLGGIHGIQSATFTSPSLSAGSHTIEIFYADQDQVQAQLAFTDGGTPVSATPEPGSLALLGTGVLGIAGTLRRRMMR